jgi:transcription initiation factor IIE alpha subunit
MSDYFVEAPLPLFTQRAPAARGSITSAQAADSLGPATLNAMQRRVLELLQATPEGLTDEEMQRRLGMNPSTQRPRRIELARRGLIVTAGTRKTASGRNADVWRATAASR